VQRRALLDRGDWAEEEPRRKNADVEDAGEEGGPLFLTEKRGVGHEKIQETKRHRFELIGWVSKKRTHRLHRFDSDRTKPEQKVNKW
jgi:hypothetical protein